MSTRSASPYTPHGGYLRPLLSYIALVDADLVDPQSDWLSRIANVLHRAGKGHCDLEC